MTSADEERYRRLIVRAVVVFLTGLVLVWLLFALRKVLLLLYVAGLLAVGLSPIVRHIERRRGKGGRKRRLPRWAAILVLYIAMLLTIAGMLSILLPPLIEQAAALWTALPDLAARGQQTLRRWGLWSGKWSWADLARSLPSPELAISGIFSALQGLLGVVVGDRTHGARSGNRNASIGIAEQESKWFEWQGRLKLTHGFDGRNPQFRGDLPILSSFHELRYEFGQTHFSNQPLGPGAQFGAWQGRF